MAEKVYLASRFSRGDEMERYSMHLRGVGVVVTSRWHSDPTHRAEWRGPEVSDANFNARLASEDLFDVNAADVLLSFTGPGGRGGRHVEFGMAVALGKRLLLVGPREHVFHWLPEVEVFPNFPSCFERVFLDRLLSNSTKEGT